MMTGWIIFSACALMAMTAVNAYEKAKQKKAAKSDRPEEDLNKELMERNNRMMEEARRKGLAA